MDGREDEQERRRKSEENILRCTSLILHYQRTKCFVCKEVIIHNNDEFALLRISIQYNALKTKTHTGQNVIFLVMIQKARQYLAILPSNISHRCMSNMEVSAKRVCPLNKCYSVFKNTSQTRRRSTLHIKDTRQELFGAKPLSPG